MPDELFTLLYQLGKQHAQELLPIFRPEVFISGTYFMAYLSGYEAGRVELL